jgi:ABC-type sugar transport system permease subunit
MQLPIASEPGRDPANKGNSGNAVGRFLRRRTRSGQSILLVAFAFITLIAFVGIAVDVAVMFVRYNALRRAVDSAAIAAAGQVREGSNFLTLNAVAQQFIELQGGVNPGSVLVETCETDVENYRRLFVRPNGTDGFPYSGQYADSVYRTPLEDLLRNYDDPSIAGTTPKTDLCRRDPLKLVRVSAQLWSPTTFLSLIGWRGVTLVATSTSQTATLDVALVIDNSITMSNGTKFEQQNRTLYPCPDSNGNGLDSSDYLGDGNCKAGYNRDYYDTSSLGWNIAGATDPWQIRDLRNFRPFTNSQTDNPPGLGLAPFDGPGLDDPTTPAVPDYGAANLGAGNEADWFWNTSIVGGDDYDPTDPWTDDDPSDGTEVRFTNDSENPNNKDGMSLVGTQPVPGIRRECFFNFFPSGVTGGFSSSSGNYHWGGCCNDPTTQTNPYMAGTTRMTFAEAAVLSDPDWYIYDDGTQNEPVIQTLGDNPQTAAANDGAEVLSGLPDYNFSDLVCRPFKDVRDAARRFISRLDFVRGDRLTLITFNADARWVPPYVPKRDNGGAIIGLEPGYAIPVMTDKDTAIRTLNWRVGLSVLNSYSADQCRAWMGIHEAYPQLTATNGTGYLQPRWEDANTVRNQYWVRAQCADTNTGGGIQIARAALTDSRWVRREAVWVMVMLSDGFANRTPGYNESGQPDSYLIGGPPRDWLTVMPGDQTVPAGMNINDYCNPGGSQFGTKPHLCASVWGYGLQNRSDTRGEESGPARMSWGFCPHYTYCRPGSPGCLAADTDAKPYWYDYDPRLVASGVFAEPRLPFCTDADPDSRFWCMDANGVINGETANCDSRYGPDDYARDQADFAGLINYIDADNEDTTFTRRVPGNFISMFTIFFSYGEDEVNVTNNPPLNDRALAVKLLRYIADAGDNGVIDNNLQRWYRTNRTLSNDLISQVRAPGRLGGYKAGWEAPFTTSVSAGGYGFPAEQDPCAVYDINNYDVDGNGTPENIVPGWQQTPPTYELNYRTDCGNFFYASSITKVNKAFTEIAGRLFTRLAR